MQFKLRSLFVVMTICAFLAVPTFDYCTAVVESWYRTPNVEKNQLTIQLPEFSVATVTTVVSVPDGETIIYSGVKRPLRESPND